MNINIRLKILFQDLIKTKKRKNHLEISGIPCEDMESVCDIIFKEIKDNFFFCYKDGSSNINSELKIIEGKNASNYFIQGYILYTIDTLDFLMMGKYEGLDGDVEYECLELDASGRLATLLEVLAKNFSSSGTKNRCQISVSHK